MAPTACKREPKLIHGSTPKDRVLLIQHELFMRRRKRLLGHRSVSSPAPMFAPVSSYALWLLVRVRPLLALAPLAWSQAWGVRLATPLNWAQGYSWASKLIRSSLHSPASWLLPKWRRTTHHYSTICITPTLLLCMRTTCLRRSCSIACEHLVFHKLLTTQIIKSSLLNRDCSLLIRPDEVSSYWSVKSSKISIAITNLLLYAFRFTDF